MSLPTGIQTLEQIARQTDKSGDVVTIVDYMKKKCPMIDDASAITGNLDSGHQVFQTTSKPEGEYTGFNEGTAAEQSTGRDITFLCGSHTGKLVVHEKQIRNIPNASAIFNREAELYVSGMTEKNQKTMLYGDMAKVPKGYDGFYKWYSDTTDPIYGEQVYDCGGTGTDNASILFVSWGPSQATIITPKGSKAGIQVIPQGKTQIVDANGKLMTALVTDLELNMGIAISDPRAVVRAANISMSALKTDPSKLFEHLAYAQERLEASGKVIMYVPKRLQTILSLAAFNKANASLTYEQVSEFKTIVRWCGYPIHIIDAMTTNEQKVS